MILILTNKEDSHSDEVIRRLSERNIKVFRLNSEDLLTKYSTTLCIDKEGQWYGEIIDEVGRTASLHELRVAWFRKPDFDFLGRIAETDEDHFVISETKALLNILYSLPNIKWINDPFVSSKSKVKFQQLLLAAQYGVKTPRTLITTRPVAAREFFVNCGENILVKNIYTGSIKINNVEHGVPSRKVGSDEFYRTYESIRLCPTQLQEYIDKAFELRVTVIGPRAFAVRIDSQIHEETKVDWRFYTQLNPHSEFVLPRNIAEFCIQFLKEQGLLFGAMDFIVTPTDEYYFLENNPFGQYLWLEVETGIPLTEEICNLLVQYAEIPNR